MSDSTARLHLRRQLDAHLIRLGYSCVRVKRPGSLMPEIVRLSPVRGRIVYGETALSSDLRRPAYHERLLLFSQRRTRQRSSILFFIAVAEVDQPELEALLQQLDIRNGVRGGHVHVVPVAMPGATGRRTAARASQGPLMFLPSVYPSSRSPPRNPSTWSTLPAATGAPSQPIRGILLVVWA